MHDIKAIRQNPEAFDAALARRGYPSYKDVFLDLDKKKREVQTRIEGLQSQRNELAKTMGAVKGKPTPEQLENIRKSQAFGREIKELEDVLPEYETALKNLLETLPNLPADDVPLGTDENSNVELRKVGSKPTLNFKPKEHFELGEQLGLMDFEGAAKLSGARFVALKGGLARMERALANFMLDIHTTQFGYTEVVPPFLVRDNAVYGTGQLPKFSEDLFRTENGFWLIPTAEVPLTNLVADSILDEESLPIRMTAYTPCFRSEAGAAGKDTRGMIRQHQFSKVELVSIATPGQSAAEHERMTGAAEEVLKKLGLHYRVMVLCTGDMGFSAQKTYDIEVWLPGQDAYREISSCSNCGAFQARRMKTRYKAKGGKETQAVHTLNGSGLALGRTMIAVMENYQNEDGTITVPEALRPYMGGLEKISK